MSLYKRLHEQPQPPTNGDPFNPDTSGVSPGAAMAADGVTPLDRLPPPPPATAMIDPPAPIPTLPSLAETGAIEERSFVERLGETRIGRAATYAGKMGVNGFRRSVGDFPKYKIHPVRTPLEKVVANPAKKVFGTPANAVANTVSPARRRKKAREAMAEAVAAEAAAAEAAGESPDQRKQRAISNILEYTLSYADVLPRDEVHVPQTNEAVVYARKLYELHTSRSGELQVAREEVRERFEAMRSMLPPEKQALSRYADSESWIMWDIAKQEVYSIRPYRSDKTKINYAGSAIDSRVLGIDGAEAYERTDFMRDVIAWRHLGWELHQQALQGEDMTWLDAVLPDEAKELLHTTGDDAHNGQLSSVMLAELGRYIDEALQSRARVERRGRYLTDI